MAWSLLALGLLAVVGDRHFFSADDYVKIHIVLQLLWLLLTALYYAFWEPAPTSLRVRHAPQPANA
jgi:hypothetical protein